MKYYKILTIFLALITIICIKSNFNYFSYAQEEKQYYAKIMEDNIYMYNEPSEQNENLIFEIPKSYFVKLKDNANENFYLAEYNGVEGYIKKEQVSPMNGTPQIPYATNNFRIFSKEGLELLTAPSYTVGEIITVVPYLTENLLYIGKIYGEIAIPDKSGIWYYAEYKENEQIYQGYLYSVFCDKLATIEENTETFPLITEELFPEPTSSINSLSPTAQVFIILAVSFPCAFILYSLIRPTLTNKSGIKRDKKLKLKGKRKCDYFEFDEKDLG